MSSKSELIISKIRNGVVIDHIPAGRALLVLRLLGISGREGFRVALVMNVESRKLGTKDIVKIEDKELTKDELNLVALVAPTATVNIIRDYEVISKFKVSIPDVIEGLLKCKNPRCITNQQREPVRNRFRVISREPLKLVCEYCGTIHELSDIEKYFGLA
ncbi:aspartate carbamoyltransferase regulatory subunit [Vulcanisaeta moutnovskia 768-28]|uniref:Aspartate carbamoyltransferase regulatory chain n=1 Tax=Vulcanisaeta moutnovskia (strain 768-28) TaxID=985053 RepID=F0QW76_VULM7|nr:aspartate carbamoyltransferase regulatory subunit [Vulcanisaeta moutnovskia]ADY02171.1 aspartate carbamoyltransferase regulatory subunit [Vulcanisaeta moutnovskia 768-28]